MVTKQITECLAAEVPQRGRAGALVRGQLNRSHEVSGEEGSRAEGTASTKAPRRERAQHTQEPQDGAERAWTAWRAWLP